MDHRVAYSRHYSLLTGLANSVESIYQNVVLLNIYICGMRILGPSFWSPFSPVADCSCGNKPKKTFPQEWRNNLASLFGMI